jgi:hypothetical protein
MTKKDSIKLFEEKAIRTVWDEDREEWYFSVVDVMAVLTESLDPAAYWRKLKQRLKEEGNETVTSCHGLKMLAPDGKMLKEGNKSVTNCNQLKLPAADGKKYFTDVADTQQISVLFNPFLRQRKAIVTPLNAKTILQIGESKK